MLKKKHEGFTLVEILIVVLILGVLAGSMLLSSGKSVAAAKANKIIADMTVIKDAVLAYYMENVENSPTVDKFCAQAKKYLGDTAIEGQAMSIGTGAQVYNANHIVLQLGDIYFGITTNERQNNETDVGDKWYVEAFFVNDPDCVGIQEKLKDLASRIPLFKTQGIDVDGSRISNVSEHLYDGVDVSVFMRIR